MGFLTRTACFRSFCSISSGSRSGLWFGHFKAHLFTKHFSSSHLVYPHNHYQTVNEQLFLESSVFFPMQPCHAHSCSSDSGLRNIYISKCEKVASKLLLFPLWPPGKNRLECPPFPYNLSDCGLVVSKLLRDSCVTFPSLMSINNFWFTPGPTMHCTWYENRANWDHSAAIELQAHVPYSR